MDRPTLSFDAFKSNGVYFEDIVTGYRTLNAKGREFLERDIILRESEKTDGVKIIRTRYPQREIEIEYFIEADDRTVFISRYTKLMELLNAKNAQIIFNDEADRYLVGTFQAVTDIEEAQHSRSGTFKIICPDPFKYSITEYSIPATTNQWSFTYDGTYRSYPTITVEFPATYDADGDNTNTSQCGYVGFVNQNGAMLQFGDPEEVDWADVDKPDTFVLKRNFWTLNDWTQNSATMISTNYVQTGTASPHGNALGDYYAYASSYGTGTKYHGPSISYDLTDLTVATNFKFRFDHVFKATKSQFGCFQCLLYSSSGGGTLMAGVNIVKTTKDTKAKVNVYAGSVTNATSATVNCANIGTSLIEKRGKKMYFYVGDKNQVLTVDSTVSGYIVDKVVFYFGKKGTDTAIGTNHLISCDLIRSQHTVYEDVPNSFMPSDVLTIETESASVFLDGGSATIQAQYLGALGNDWESFALQTGANLIQVDYSDWTTTPPIATMKYRKVYL